MKKLFVSRKKKKLAQTFWVSVVFVMVGVYEWLMGYLAGKWS